MMNKEHKPSPLLHNPFSLFIAVLSAVIIVGGLTHVLVPQIEHAAMGVALVFVAIRLVIGSLTVAYSWNVRYYLAHCLDPVVRRARDEGYAMRPAITDGDCLLYLSALNVAGIAVVAVNMWVQVYLKDPQLLGGIVLLTSTALYTVFYFAARYFIIRRIVRNSWVATARPVR